MEEEITEVTIIQKQKKTAPSFWANTATLVILCTIIIAVQQWSKNWIGNSAPITSEDADKHIVLEDLETEKPLVEAETVVVPQVEEKSELQTSKPKINPKSKITKSKPKKRKTKTLKTVKRSPFAKPDPYTDGGPMDLDRPENRDAAQRREATATPVLPTERDQFIPFEESE